MSVIVGNGKAETRKNEPVKKSSKEKKTEEGK